jgi:peroxiredoxin family protein
MAVEEAALQVPVHEHEEHAHQKLVIIASSDDLDKTWAQLLIANAGAAMGMETTIFYTFWGLFSLVEDGKRTGENWMQKMVAMLDRPGMGHLKLSRMNFGGAGPAMMKKLAREHNVAGPGELLQLALDMGVKLVPCQMTMDLLGLKREDLIEGVGEPVGATAMLLEARDAATFFI